MALRKWLGLFLLRWESSVRRNSAPRQRLPLQVEPLEQRALLSSGSDCFSFRLADFPNYDGTSIQGLTNSFSQNGQLAERDGRHGGDGEDGGERLSSGQTPAGPQNDYPIPPAQQTSGTSGTSTFGVQQPPLIVLLPSSGISSGTTTTVATTTQSSPGI
jgi:hypothetical protein